jgi:hypothetical protein
MLVTVFWGSNFIQVNERCDTKIRVLCSEKKSWFEINLYLGVKKQLLWL